MVTRLERRECRGCDIGTVFHKLIDASQVKTQLKQLDIDLKEETLLMHTVID